ncbi:Uncharacterised protein [Streptococcus pneumoniae]|nr:Uncharacterised protein [Streptococcus pneumoniae]
MLVVDAHALGLVHVLHLVHEEPLRGPRAEHAQDLLRVHGAGHELRAHRHVLAVGHEDARTAQHRVGDLLGAVVRREQQAHGRLGVLDGHAAGDLGDRGHALRGAGLEELLDAGQTLRDVVGRGHTAGVERAHGELGARLTDRLGRDDADGLADVHQLAGGHGAAVALRAGAHGGLAGQDRADLDLRDAGGHQLADQHVAHVRTGRGQHRAVLARDVLGQRAGEGRVLDLLVGHQLAVGVRGGDRDGQAALGAAVVLADDDVLGHIDETTGQVARVRGLQRGVREALAGAVGGGEVLEHGQALAVRGLDRTRDDLTLRVGHEAADARDLAHLEPVASRTGGHHAVDGVELRQAVLHGRGDLVGGLVPDVDQLGATLVVRDQALVVLLLHALGLLLVALHDGGLVEVGGDVRDRHGHTRPGAPVEAGVLEVVQRLRGDDHRVALGQVVDQLTEGALGRLLVQPRVVVRQQLVEQHLAQGGLDEGDLALGPALGGRHVRRRHEALDADPCGRVQVQVAAVERHDGLADGRVQVARADLVRTHRGEVVQSDDHVLGRHGDRAAVRGLQDVVAREHEQARLGLGLRRQGQVDRHLVAVEVRVERGADQRVQLQGLAFHELRLEGLDAQTVQGGGAVQQDRVLGDDLLEHVPDLRTEALHHALGGLDVLRVVQVHETLHHERLEQLQRHLLRQAALVQLELGTHHDDRAARVVHALAEQVLTEPALLALEHVGE